MARARRRQYMPTLTVRQHPYTESVTVVGCCAQCGLPEANRVHTVVSAWDVAQLAAGEAA
jgi:hypothetical protein